MEQEDSTSERDFRGPREGGWEEKVDTCTMSDVLRWSQESPLKHTLHNHLLEYGADGEGCSCPTDLQGTTEEIHHRDNEDIQPVETSNQKGD